MVKTKQKKKQEDILDALGASLLENLLTEKGVKTKILKRWVIKAIESIRARQDFYYFFILWLIFS